VYEMQLGSCEDYRDVVAPILITWLPRIAARDVRCDIVEMLRSPKAPPEVVRVLLAELSRVPQDAPLGDRLLWSIREALEVTTGRQHFDELSRIAVEPGEGIRRLATTCALARMDAPEARDVLVRMLGSVHPDWVWTVLEALWRIEPAVLCGARSAVEPLVHDPRHATRREAAKVLRRIGWHEAQLKRKERPGR